MKTKKSGSTKGRFGKQNKDPYSVRWLLQQRRVTLRLGVEEVAQKLGTTYTFISKLEGGTAALPAERSVQIANILGIEYSELLSRVTRDNEMKYVRRSQKEIKV